MGRYFFDTEDDATSMRDEIGLEFPDDNTACREAAGAMGGIAKDAIASDGRQKSLTMTVRDDGGRAVSELVAHFLMKLPV